MNSLTEVISSNPVIGIINVGGIPAPQLQKMRNELRGKMQLIVTKNNLLDRALKDAMDNLDSIAEESDSGIPPAEIAAYWRGMCYSFPDDCKQGLTLFEKHLIELNLL